MQYMISICIVKYFCRLIKSDFSSQFLAEVTVMLEPNGFLNDVSSIFWPVTLDGDSVIIRSNIATFDMSYKYLCMFNFQSSNFFPCVFCV